MEKIDLTYELSFPWHKHQFGYKWADAAPCSPWGEPYGEMDGGDLEKYKGIIPFALDGPFLVEKSFSIMRFPFEPLADNRLFAWFSDIIPDKESFVRWADEYGRLVDVEGNAQYSYDFILSPYTDESGLNVGLSTTTRRIVERNGLLYQVTKPDPLSFWKQEHRDLSLAVMLWEMALKDDPRLNGILEWHEDPGRAYVYPVPRHRLTEVDFRRIGKDRSYSPSFVLPPRRIEDYRPQRFNAKRAALTYVRQEINKKMRLYPLYIRFDTDENGGIHRVIEPTSLLSAMWHQFFLAQTGEIRLRRCSVCGKWEDMKTHRESWSKHKNCANYQRLKKSRAKKREMLNRDRP
ncbi:MAG: hypothetical protein LBS53_12955 [Synergistaceae bacterium]|jgi:hypothetical protein|nr:hypothetical protein [Synergistaceae bacterium]